MSKNQTNKLVNLLNSIKNSNSIFSTLANKVDSTLHITRYNALVMSNYLRQQGWDNVDIAHELMSKPDTRHVNFPLPESSVIATDRMIRDFCARGAWGSLQGNSFSEYEDSVHRFCSNVDQPLTDDLVGLCVTLDYYYDLNRRWEKLCRNFRSYSSPDHCKREHVEGQELILETVIDEKNRQRHQKTHVYRCANNFMWLFRLDQNQTTFCTMWAEQDRSRITITGSVKYGQRELKDGKIFQYLIIDRVESFY